MPVFWRSDGDEQVAPAVALDDLEACHVERDHEGLPLGPLARAALRMVIVRRQLVLLVWISISRSYNGGGETR